MIRLTAALFVVAALQSGTALAQSGLPVAGDDVRPAAPTGTAPPDGGRRYEYPPNTGAILRPENRSQYDRPAADPASKSSVAEPSPAGTNPSNKPPEQVGR